MFECGTCTFLNDPGLKSCEMCSSSLSKKIKSSTCSEIRKEVDLYHENLARNFNSTACTEGIIELMSEVMIEEGVQFKLCSSCPHITQQGFLGSRWSCGFRNIQMLCHTLIQKQKFKKILFNGDGEIPDVYGIQSWIEKAWAAGFDTMGCEQLGGSIIGTDIWIGATECVALLRYFGVRCKIIQFVNYKSNKSLQSSSSGVIAKSNTTFSNFTNKGTLHPYFSTLDRKNQIINYRATESSSTTNGHNKNLRVETKKRTIEKVICLDDSNSVQSSPWKHPLSGVKRKAQDEDHSQFDWSECVKDYSIRENSTSNHLVMSETIPEHVLNKMESVCHIDLYRSDRNFDKCNTFMSRSNVSIQADAQAKDSEIGTAIGIWIKRYFTAWNEHILNQTKISNNIAIEVDIDDDDDDDGECIPPIYFQHDGHSRCIVGFEETNIKFSLLMFDPSSNGAKLKMNLIERNSVWKKQVKRSLSTLNCDAYQLVCIYPGLMSREEREASKVMDCEEVRFANIHNEIILLNS